MTCPRCNRRIKHKPLTPFGRQCLDRIGDLIEENLEQFAPAVQDLMIGRANTMLIERMQKRGCGQDGCGLRLVRR